MNSRFHPWLWAQTLLALAAVALAVATSLWPQWIEELLGVDPDGGSGALEWTLLGSVWFAAALSSTVAIRSHVQLAHRHRS